MWCTRWFLPLLLLPLPTASPYFLLLFLFSLTMHAKPCFYCIVLLTTIFVSSCYWQPLPLDSPLSFPWAENITTFTQALHNTIQQNYSRPFPDTLQVGDRCWCDFSTGGFFEPFNVTHWEYVSVVKLKDELEQATKTKSEESMHRGARSVTEQPLVPSQSVNSGLSSVSHPPATTFPIHATIRSIALDTIRNLFNPSIRVPPLSVSSSSSSTPSISSVIPMPQLTDESTTLRTKTLLPANLPLIRREYDLRLYGFGISIDFGWRR